jgi:acetyl esterase/lipase
MVVNVTWDQIRDKRPTADGERIAYGGDRAHQYGVLRLPVGPGPHPIASVLHGGCWRAAYDHGYIDILAESLTERGLATWVLEYRRIGDEGGTWPGTFLDVARGHDFLRVLAPERGLDLDRVVTIGHSAGGHLALWLAARPRVPTDSEVHVAGPLPVDAVVSLAGITDLRTYVLGTGSCNAAVIGLMGGRPRRLDARYSAANPLDLAPLGVPLTFVHGDRDDTVPLEQSQRLAARERAGGGVAEVVVIPNAGHFDLVAPESSAWSTVEREILKTVNL